MSASTDDARALAGRAATVLRANDRGGYTVPSDRLYPYQWNWDSAFAALGWLAFDEPRAWQEIERLLEGQWRSGMVPQIVFHAPSDDYFPGPEHWRLPPDARPPGAPETSGISQPPVLATATRIMLERASEAGAAEAACSRIYPRLLAWHRWWWRARDPDGCGLVAIVHPWESGMDNSAAWDGPLARVAASRVDLTARRDVTLVDASERPRDRDYQAYLSLVESCRSLGYDEAQMMRQCPFRVLDVGVNAILQRATLDLLALADRFGDAAEREQILARVELGERAMAGLWRPHLGLFTSHDAVTDEPIEMPTSAGLLALFARAASEQQATQLAALIERWASKARYLVPSMDPEHPEFDPRRYWRGPVWAMMNWMIGDGLARYGHAALAERIAHDTRALVAAHGFREYYDPIEGEGLGGHAFTWTAAIALHWKASAGSPRGGAQ